MVATAGKQSSLGRYNWLKDIQSVSPMEAIPHWMLSNYFYREMHSVLRLLVLPFLVLFSISIVALFGALLEEYGILNSTVFSNNEIFSSFGFVGNIIDIIIMVNGILILFAIPLAIPILLFSRDVRETLKRFGIFPEDELVLEKESDHIDIARKVFKQNPDIKIYLYGHTHNPFIEKLHELQDSYFIYSQVAFMSYGLVSKDERPILRRRTGIELPTSNKKNIKPNIQQVTLPQNSRHTDYSSRLSSRSDVGWFIFPI